MNGQHDGFGIQIKLCNQIATKPRTDEWMIDRTQNDPLVSIPSRASYPRAVWTTSARLPTRFTTTRRRPASDRANSSRSRPSRREFTPMRECRCLESDVEKCSFAVGKHALPVGPIRLEATAREYDCGKGNRPLTPPMGCGRLRDSRALWERLWRRGGWQ